MIGIISAAGLIGLLSDEPELKSFALNQLVNNVDLLWPEIADSIGQMYVDYRHGHLD